MNELIQGRFWVSAVHLTGAQALGHGQRHPTRLKPHSPIKGMVGRCTAVSELSMHYYQCVLAMQETRVRSLGQENPLEKENGNPLHYSCLENPKEGGAR